jgi:predicted DNA-binding protein (MmcQ/YjbR family)
MTHDELRQFCMSFPGATEDIKWGADLCFSIGGKMFCVTGADSMAEGLSVKCTPEKFDELCERDGIAPAAYVGRYKWARISNLNSVTTDELRELIATSYSLVFEKLPKSVRDGITGAR